jgi:hypothetical protein
MNFIQELMAVGYVVQTSIDPVFTKRQSYEFHSWISTEGYSERDIDRIKYIRRDLSAASHQQLAITIRRIKFRE